MWRGTPALGLISSPAARGAQQRPRSGLLVLRPLEEYHHPSILEY